MDRYGRYGAIREINTEGKKISDNNLEILR